MKEVGRENQRNSIKLRSLAVFSNSVCQILSIYIILLVHSSFLPIHHIIEQLSFYLRVYENYLLPRPLVSALARAHPIIIIIIIVYEVTNCALAKFFLALSLIPWPALQRLHWDLPCGREVSS